MAGANVKTFTNANWKAEVLEATQPVLVDFWAAWCGPCRMIAPVIDQLADEYVGKVVVGKLNVDENRETAIEYGVMSIPTLLLFKDGKPVERIVGYQTKEQLARILAKHI
ncbi:MULTISPECIES: thioredoxin [Carboxydocella]|uniref:Thioredoxin n=2 Tax=Carboxydocella TaxID=178898 RepID=A0A1T4PSR2_9FIRM|nr:MULTISPECIES: thioredoxin [Carboxydocella]AVX19672.1 thioredoxin [Carboxydocella thermautotrophica]AVX30077.1 thioredoxin [Carboxydocella thermautotrophica]SJZ94316.1 thioredoxin [Carboxydocella sporoproducens DSM 16521]GAW29534.1 thioredoxin [Carboxydocella sp. ULO1]GAW31320.1 thioredoxin [Carboxydocella sp. JDF658]